MTTFEKTDRNRVRRVPELGQYDSATVYEIFDAALICHVGIVGDEQPVVIPMLHALDGDRLLLHGASSSRLQLALQGGHPICVTVTHVDGIVLARSIFNHSMNYRSAVIFGRGALISNETEKLSALERFSEKMMPGRWQDARPPSDNELKATSIVTVEIESASAKISSGPPDDEEEDYALPFWAGVVPIRQVLDMPVDDPRLLPGQTVPEYVYKFVRERDI